MRYFTFLSVIAFFTACLHTKTAPKTAENTANPTGSTAFNPEATFKNYCSGCHGERVETFVDRQWKKGNSRKDIIKSITNGDVNAGMAAFGAVLKPAEIESMADFILKAIERGKTYEYDDRPKSNVFTSSYMTVRLDTIAKGLEHP